MLLLAATSLGAEGMASLRGTVVDALGAPVRAQISLMNAQGVPAASFETEVDGTFDVPLAAPAPHVLRIQAAGFEPQYESVGGSQMSGGTLRIVLSPAHLLTQITVTATRGTIEELEKSQHVVSARNLEHMLPRPAPTIGNSLEGLPGVLVQQSTYGQTSVFLRGLTGNQVLHLIDGIRFNNSIYRFGPNQYLALIEPSQVQRVEAMLGPTGAQYGSDALGGTINLITAHPEFHSGRGLAVHGDFAAYGGTADASGGANGRVSLASDRVFWVAGAAGRRLNDLRAGQGLDSRNVFRRYFGLTDDQVRSLAGERLQDTGFSQSGLHTKLAVRLPAAQNFGFWYQRSGQDGVRGYKDLLGGLGQLQAAFDPQRLDFLYARYEKAGVGFLDSLAGTFSLNAQRDGFLRQGLRMTDPVITENTKVASYGYSVQGTTHIWSRQALVFGTDIYQEHVDSARLELTPGAGTVVERRGVYPNGSRYRTAALFAHDTVDLVPGRLRAVLGGRFTGVHFRTFADRNRDSMGRWLGVADSSQSFRDLTFHSSVSLQITSRVGWHALVGRGFRAPNLNDLGAVGLNDLGYEVPASDVQELGALAGDSSGEGALPSGKRVRKLASERLFNYETGFTWQSRRTYLRLQAFDAEIYDPIVRRTLLFPAAGVPASVAGIEVQPIPATPAQQEQGVVTVATSLDRRAVKAFVNDGRQRYYGVEALGRIVVLSAWTIDAQYTFLTGRELFPNRNVRRLPPQHGTVSLRYVPRGRRYWIEAGGFVSGAQTRLSGGDLGDERIGAQRSRSDIAAFFRGARAGAVDDVFLPTGETLRQLQDRVLPLGATFHGIRIADDNTRVPLYPNTPGYVSVDLGGGIRLGEAANLYLGISNVLDRNYRVHGSGVDAPGRNFWIAYKYSF
jgi:outer membrane receptor protein involved in Fe transport